MRVQHGSKHAAGSVMELPTRAERSWRAIEAAGHSDLESVPPPYDSPPKATGTDPLREAATYGSPNYLGPYTAHGTTAGHDHMRLPGHDPRHEPLAASGGGIFREDMICGVRKQMFWVIMATGTFALVATIVIGVGLGVALRRSDASNSNKD